MSQTEQKLETSFHRRSGKELFEEHAKDKEAEEKKWTREHQANLQIIKTILDESAHMNSNELVEIQQGREYVAVWSCYKNYYIQELSFSLKGFFASTAVISAPFISLGALLDYLSDSQCDVWCVAPSMWLFVFALMTCFWVYMEGISCKEWEQAINDSPFKIIKETSASKGGVFAKRSLLQAIHSANVDLKKEMDFSGLYDYHWKLGLIFLVALLYIMAYMAWVIDMAG